MELPVFAVFPSMLPDELADKMLTTIQAADLLEKFQPTGVEVKGEGEFANHSWECGEDHEVDLRGLMRPWISAIPDIHQYVRLDKNREVDFTRDFVWKANASTPVNWEDDAFIWHLDGNPGHALCAFVYTMLVKEADTPDHPRPCEVLLGTRADGFLPKEFDKGVYKGTRRTDPRQYTKVYVQHNMGYWLYGAGIPHCIRRPQPGFTRFAWVGFMPLHKRVMSHVHKKDMPMHEYATTRWRELHSPTLQATQATRVACSHRGCLQTFTTERNMNRHVKEKHKGQKDPARYGPAAAQKAKLNKRKRYTVFGKKERTSSSEDSTLHIV